MKLIKKLFNKIFLTKEIVSKEGEVHFRRYRLFACPLLRIYVHQILRSDLDYDMHDHPWNFVSLILEGAYKEESTYAPSWQQVWTRKFYSFDLVNHKASDAHRLTLISSEVWTLVFAWGWTRPWGYQTPNGWIGHRLYRRLKNESNLNQ